MTVRETAFLIHEYYLRRLNSYERSALKNIVEGICGTGPLNDEAIKEYLSDKQIGFIKTLGKKFRVV
jgi:hypothetical protein